MLHPSRSRGHGRGRAQVQVIFEDLGIDFDDVIRR